MEILKQHDYHVGFRSTLYRISVYLRFVTSVQLTQTDLSHTSGPIAEMSQGELSDKTATR